MKQQLTQHNLLPLYIFLLGIPLGTAGQAFALGLSIIITIYLICKYDCKTNLKEFWNYLITKPYILIIIYLLWMLIATLLNYEYPRKLSKLLEFIGGYGFFVIIPPLFVVYYKNLHIKKIEALFWFISALIGILALICLSQYLLGWHREGFNIVHGMYRASGLYSHPLTLAYVACIIWPLSIYAFFIKPKEFPNMLIFFSMILILWTSQSRAVQVLAFLFLIFNIFVFIKTKLKWLYLILVFLVLIAAYFIPNKVRAKFQETFTNNPQRTTEKYIDDRLAFWDAHWQLIKQKPLTGHGIFIPDELLNKAYEKIGLENFSKKYGAHNIYIQIAAEGGIIGLILYLSWFLWFCVFPYLKIKSYNMFLASIVAQSWIMFALASLTQNAFQDYEVRYTLCGLCLISLILYKNFISYNSINDEI